MPWSTPTLRQVRTNVRDAVRAALPGSDANVPNSILRVMCDVMGALCHLTLQYIDWLSKQLLPDTAEHEWLDRHGRIWLVNADGSRGRKLATLATGVVSYTGINGSIVPLGTQLTGSGGIGYEMTDEITIGSGPTDGPVRALDPGTQGNQDPGSTMAVSGPPPGVDGSATVVLLENGTDDETDDELRARILLRIQQPPMGGSESDYVQWALDVPGVTRAWASPEMGIGTMTVRFLEDDLRADDDGWPTPDDVLRVEDYLDTVRPVTVKDLFVEAPIKYFVDVTIANLDPDTDEVKAEIEQSFRAMLHAKAAPGQTIFVAWISAAIMQAPHITSFQLISPTTDIAMPNVGSMAVLRNIVYV
jgi:uncharacterized phage protein gp47/JayE